MNTDDSTTITNKDFMLDSTETKQTDWKSIYGIKL